MVALWRCCVAVCGVAVLRCCGRSAGGGGVKNDNDVSEGGGYGDRTHSPCDIMMYPTYFFRVFGFLVTIVVIAIGVV